MGRLSEVLSLLVKDTGWFRELYDNRGELPGPLLRMSQPSPWRLSRLVRNLDLRAVINLRGSSPDQAWYRLERQACAELQVECRDVRIFSRQLLTPEELLEIKTLVETMPLPALIHCKSGADRAGLFAALYRVWRLGHPVEEARQELHWRYGHFRTAKTGVLDYFLEVYLRERQAGESLEGWIRRAYCPHRLQAEFRPSGSMGWLVDRILRRE